MYRLSSIILISLLFTLKTSGQEMTSPHGPDLKIDCRACHTTESWQIDMTQISFNHDTLDFPLEGQHANQACWSCHTDLVFKNVKTECASCHMDIHQQSLGSDCARCHNVNSWIIDDVTGMHERISFPLLGAHAQANCYDCHLSDSELRFEPIGTECISCHRQDFEMTENPDHVGAGFSTDCTECHKIDGSDWGSNNFEHSFFPLEGGHDISDCAACHTTANYSDASPDCFSCHSDDYNNTTQPSHRSANISTDCKQCHTTDPGWIPADFLPHDGQYFPIYSGKHKGEWNACVDCHTTLGDFSTFDCLTCHTNPETDNEHGNVPGYVYNNDACLACHPTGDADEKFDHNATAFPLTGAHTMTDCLACHANGYKGTSTFCADCHQMDYNQTQNPDHQLLDLSNDCAQCHTTTPDWMPAGFPVHNDFYPLIGAHASIANDCVTCHNGDYTNTPSTCSGCHLVDYQNTRDPDHEVLRFSLECQDCHTQSSWVPSTFDHDGQFFPIYSGEHAGEWNECMDCHHVPGDYTQFTCITCHELDETNDQHKDVPGYVYSSDACLACHPTGDKDVVFDHNATAFPLTGAHTMTDCLECHSGGFRGTPTDCAACHSEDFNNTQNPNHSALGLTMDCATCHTTDPEWKPALMPNHDDYYMLRGAHVAIANDCAACHAGDYNNTPNECVGCHLSDYEMTTDPDHQTLSFSNDCTECHGEDAWVPSTFEHEGFPIYSGKHMGKWTDCRECHLNVNDYMQFTCTTCHINPETDDQHIMVQGYIYNSDACLACHPTGEADMAFDHSTTNFPLTGGHIGVDCFECHSGGFMGTPTNCDACHQMDYQGSTNPNHAAIGIPLDCDMCHTTEPGWAPASFPIHDTYYMLNGAHAAIADQCTDCHMGDYNNTPTECVGCHQMDYDETMNPDHVQSQFGTDCASCHTEDAWVPSTFDHDGMHFPINSGTHAGQWSECIDCHTNPMDYMVFSCIDCHEHNKDDTDEDHVGVNGYSYNSTACFICHPTGRGDEGFDHSTTNFPLTGAHLMVACLDCHMNGYAGTPTNCDACHQMDYDATSNPNHSALGLSTDCIVCHTTDPGWMPAQFPDHDSYYQLTGAHVSIANQCADCHMGDYNNTPTECKGCHQDDYDATTNPDHDGIGIPTACDDCHTTDPGWMPAEFPDHDSYYPLTGAHLTVASQCALCHMGDYNNTPTECKGCHQNDYDASTNPNHQSLGIPTECDNCHTTDPGWKPATFDIHDNYYPLTGAHQAIAHLCADCHMGDYNNTPNTCDGCHLSDYNNTSNPNHSSIGIPITCDDCHTTDPGWRPATFGIHDNYYPLTGAHQAIASQCADCHMGDYNNTPNTCDGCHISDYNSSTNPNHGSLGIPTTCDDCHTTDPNWMPATFDIHDNYYRLNGAHQVIANQCFDCHMGDYNNTPNTCYGCHATDYNNTTNPDHAAAQFPTTCDDCHSETAWIPSTWDHDNMYFPIYSGKHDKEWTQCIDCHTTPGNYSLFSCINCHEHNDQTQVDEDHDQVAGYSYNSMACYNCHPTGEK